MNNKIIMIKGKQSEWYEQAIFVLKENKRAMPVNLVNEAEKIIAGYMLRTHPKSLQKDAMGSYQKNSGKPVSSKQATAKPAAKSDGAGFILINICMILCCVMLGYFLRGFFL